MTKFTIRCDPEIFLIDVDNKPLSAHGLIPGTKAAPHPIPCGAIQVDGIAAEFNTTPVALEDFDSFNENIVRVVQTLSKTVKESKPDAKFSIAPTLHFDNEFLEALPEEAKELGCDPDYNAYTLEPNPRPDGDRMFRTGAGHIHIGWGVGIPVDNEEHMKICADFVKMLDLWVGFGMTFIDRNPERRELYGKAGAFRPKPYGVEYRTPSNVWIRTKSFRRLIHTLVNKAVTNMRSGYTSSSFGYTDKDIQDVINNGNHMIAKRFLDNNLSSMSWAAVSGLTAEQLGALK